MLNIMTNMISVMRLNAPVRLSRMVKKRVDRPIEMIYILYCFVWLVSFFIDPL